jgi:hypothetical protein
MVRHDKHEIPEWLKERISVFESLISVLQATKNSMLSLSFSPTNDLIRTTIESLEMLRRAFSESWPRTARSNPQIEFDERFSDEIGNVSQRTKNIFVATTYDPEMENIISDLIVFFSRSLDPSYNTKKGFHDLFGKEDKFLPPGGIPQKSKNAEKSKKNIKEFQAQRARNFYYRRRRQK